MGCYDSVFFTCPNCGGQIEAQSKGGLCDMIVYPSEAVPVEVARDLRIWKCKCGKLYRVKPIETHFVQVEIEEEEDH